MAITHSIKFAASAKEAAAEILKYEDQIVSTASTVDRMAASLSGEQIFRASHNWVAAVEQIGGATKLTAAEKERLHARLGEVIEKYEVLGHTAPTQLRQVYDATAPATQATESWTTSLVKNAGAYVAGMATWETAKAVIRGVKDFVVESVQAYAEEEAAVKKLTVALSAQGTAAPATLQAYRDMAAGLQQMTTYADDAVLASQALLVQVGNVMPHQMARALEATTNLASGLGIDLEAATMLVAKAFAGKTETLSRYGVVVDETQLKLRGVDAVLDVVQQKFGGQAQAEIETMSGRLKQAANLWGDLKEKIGETVATDPLVQAFLRNTTDSIERMNQAAANGQGPAGLGGWIQLLSRATPLPIVGDWAVALERAAEKANAAEAEAQRLRAEMAKPLPVSTWLDIDTLTAGQQAVIDTTAILEWSRQQIEAQAAKPKNADDALAQIDAIRERIRGLKADTAALSAADAIYAHQLRDLGESHSEIARLLGVSEGRVRAYFDAWKGGEEAVKRQDALFGRDLIARAQQYAQDLGGIENITKLTTAKKQELSDAVGKALDAYRALGREAPIELHRIWIAATELSDPALTRGLPEGLLRNLRSVKDEAYWVGQATADQLEAGMTYGDPGFFMDWMLHTPGSGMLQYDPRTEMRSFGRRISGAIGDGMIEVAGQLPETFAAAFTGGGSASGAFKAIGMQVGGVVGDALGAEIGSKVGTSLKGSLGDKLGGALGGALGSAVGFAIQGVVALIGQIGPKSADEQILARIGSRYGATISQGLAQGIEANAKSLFRGDWLAAEIFNLGAIIDAAGGVTDASFTKWAQATRDIFVMVETGKFTTEQAATALDQTFSKLAGHLRETGALASAKFLELIDLQERFHIESAAVESYVAAQAESAIGHLTRVVETSAIQSQAAASALADTGVLALQALLDQGVPLGEALQRYDTYTASLTKRLSEAGFHGTEAFAQLQAQSALAKDAIAGPLLTSIVETALAIRDLHNGNLLTQESFGGLVSQVSGLSQQWIAQGHTAQELFPFIGTQLQTIWELQSEFGYSVDETTQNLLDQAEAAGVVGEEHRSTEDRMIEGIGRMADATERLVDLFGKAWPSAMASGTDAIVKDVKRIKNAVDEAFQTPPRWEWTPPEFPGIGPGTGVSYVTGPGGVSLPAGRSLPMAGFSAARSIPVSPAPLPPLHITVVSKLNSREVARDQVLVMPEMIDLMGGRA